MFLTQFISIFYINLYRKISTNKCIFVYFLNFSYNLRIGESYTSKENSINIRRRVQLLTDIYVEAIGIKTCIFSVFIYNNFLTSASLIQN